jgi:hypothetical protein
MRGLLARLAPLGLAVALAAGLALTVAVSPAPTAVKPAADTSQFTPGNIISDAVFFNGTAMSAGDIQAFIAVKGASCRAGADGTPCLKNFTQDTAPRAADAYCNGYAAGAGESAALIIAKVAQSCGVSPRVLLVIMQKEQSLVTNTGSSLTASRYQKTMGFACPDTAACDASYFGFQNQVYASARQFKKYAATPKSFGYQAGRVNTILYNPDRGCGSSSVYIQNQATAGLYVYTPYQPNAAALGAGYGQGDGCSAYGNRNFWLYFTDWFGSTQLPSETASLPIGAVDVAEPVTGDQIRVEGWALDPDTSSSIVVHAYVDGLGQGAFMADGVRTDVGTAYAGLGNLHGYGITLPVSQGRHEVCIYGINVAAGKVNPQLGCRTVDTSGLPYGNIETTDVVGDQGVLAGWAIDPDTTAPVTIHAYVNGVGVGAATAAASRPDVAATHSAAGPDHGFSVTVPLQPGPNDVCLYAINVPVAGTNPLLGCRVLTLQVDPVGNAEVITGGATSFTVEGWALDPETSAPIDVHVYVDGVGSGAFTADENRTDVAALYPDNGPGHGFSFELTAAPGVHQVCVYAIGVLQGGQNPSLGCRTVNVGVPPIGRIDQVQVTAYTARVSGWAVDADTQAPIDVHLYVDGRFATALTTAVSRPDIAAAFPGAGDLHGFDTTLVVPSGRHTICMFAINVAGGVGNPLLSCVAVDVDGGRSAPFGQLDDVQVVNGVTIIGGWSIDPDAPATTLPTHFYLDGRYYGQTAASTPRPDVGAAFPGAGPDHGYTGYFILPAGRHTVCTYAINSGPGTVNPMLGCRTITVP